MSPSSTGPSAARSGQGRDITDPALLFLPSRARRRPMQIDITGIISEFPDFRVAVVVADDIDVGAERAPELAALIIQREAACRSAWAGMELSEIPGIAAWRKAY